MTDDDTRRNRRDPAAPNVPRPRVRAMTGRDQRRDLEHAYTQIARLARCVVVLAVSLSIVGVSYIAHLFLGACP